MPILTVIPTIQVREGGVKSLDRRLRPYWMNCAYCTIYYDVVGDVESFGLDAFFVTYKLKLPVRKSIFIVQL